MPAELVAGAEVTVDAQTALFSKAQRKITICAPTCRWAQLYVLFDRSVFLLIRHAFLLRHFAIASPCSHANNAKIFVDQVWGTIRDTAHGM